MYNREYPKKLRVGIVGTGSHMYRNLLPAMHYLPMEIAAMCSRGQDKLLRTASEYRCPTYSSTQEMYKQEQLDAVVISVSPEQHPALVCEALENGLHVFVEKPVAMRAAEVDHMLEVSKRTGNVVVVGYKKVFMPAIEKACEIVRSEQYPGLNSILAVYPMCMPLNGREVLEQREFTNWLGNGCHPLSVMVEVAGPVNRVQSILNSQGYGVVLLQFASGVTGTFHLASGPHPIEAYQMFGEGWNLKIENSIRVELNRGVPFEYSYINNFAPEGFDNGRVVWEPQFCLATLENKALFVQGMAQEMLYFCNCVLEGREPVKGSLLFALHITQIYEAALLSEGTPIKLS